ncbi:hypothetical protein CCH79_00019008 [Gambusia affinis]|uniref:Protein kinase domain-containing protein n=1 Tax=Gambusia affinis TaxID=33528 RepID=A0A315VYC2_GAMAF|nr:hypothetical protein CCH79_00019008 [Gambusia affinis]
MEGLSVSSQSANESTVQVEAGLQDGGGASLWSPYCNEDLMRGGEELCFEELRAERYNQQKRKEMEEKMRHLKEQQEQLSQELEEKKKLLLRKSQQISNVDQPAAAPFRILDESGSVESAGKSALSSDELPDDVFLRPDEKGLCVRVQFPTRPDQNQQQNQPPELSGSNSSPLEQNQEQNQDSWSRGTEGSRFLAVDPCDPEVRRRLLEHFDITSSPNLHPEQRPLPAVEECSILDLGIILDSGSDSLTVAELQCVAFLRDESSVRSALCCLTDFSLEVETSRCSFILTQRPCFPQTGCSGHVSPRRAAAAMFSPDGLQRPCFPQTGCSSCSEVKDDPSKLRGDTFFIRSRLLDRGSVSIFRAAAENQSVFIKASLPGSAGPSWAHPPPTGHVERCSAPWDFYLFTRLKENSPSADRPALISCFLFEDGCITVYRLPGDLQLTVLADCGLDPVCVGVKAVRLLELVLQLHRRSLLHAGLRPGILASCGTVATRDWLFPLDWSSSLDLDLQKEVRTVQQIPSAQAYLRLGLLQPADPPHTVDLVGVAETIYFLLTNSEMKPEKHGSSWTVEL